jgi:hypothetical protein
MIKRVEAAATSAIIDDPVLARFRESLDAMYGDRLERVVLSGSRARRRHSGREMAGTRPAMTGWVDHQGG